MNTPVTQAMPTQQLPLADIIQPEPVGLWPLAPGWWLLLLVSVALVVLLVILLKRYLQTRRIRAQAFALLNDARRIYEAAADDETQSSASNYCRDVNQVLKRYWRHYNASPEILTSDGDRWIALLNRATRSPVFDEKVAGALAHGPYRKIARLNPDVIDNAARKWLKQASARTLSRSLSAIKSPEEEASHA